MIIGFTGAIGSGKSFAAHYLSTRHGYQQLAFAQPLKNMLVTFLRGQGVSSLIIDLMLHGNLKEVPTPYLGDRTPRRAMQTLGTEWGRELSPDLWVRAWRNAIQRPNVAVEDVRHNNEAMEIRSLGGIIVRVERTGNSWVDLTGAHSSEKGTISSDRVLYNSGDEAAYIICIEAMLAKP